MRSLLSWAWLAVAVAVASPAAMTITRARAQEPRGPTTRRDYPVLTHVAPAREASVVPPGGGDADSSSPDALIRQALSAGPAVVARNATVRAPNAAGRLVYLRRGSNGFTCYPDNPDSPGLDPMCADSQATRWMESLMRHEMRPGNSAPGIIYMLQGGSDLDARSPWSATGSGAGRWIDSPPHYMVLWAFDPATTGLSATPKRTGSWIMWAGTPYAHLMVNQVP
jgi:hypothetical protein